MVRKKVFFETIIQFYYVYYKRFNAENIFTKKSVKKLFCTLSFSHFHIVNTNDLVLHHPLNTNHPIKHEGKVGTTGLERVFRDY
jgi:hypothetical protein